MKKMILVTDNYPFELKESNFIYEELKALSHFFEITIISRSNCNKIVADIPGDIKIVRCSSKIKLLDLLKYGGKVLIDPFFWRELVISKSKKKLCKSIKAIYASMINVEKLAKFIKKNFSCECEKVILYSFWYNYSVVSLLKLKESPNIKVITRAHGYDLYDERAPLGYQMFHEQTLKEVDKVIFVCKFAMEYFIKKYPVYKDKFTFSYLGSKKEMEIRNDKNLQNEGYKLVVSCSNLIPLKRVDKIIDALGLINQINIIWVHFGDGILKRDLELYAQNELKGKPNIFYHFAGYVNNSTIKEFYSNNYVNCFVNVSETEGLPVTIMEAMSFGIPIIGTDVGGVSEEIDETNGILLTSNSKSKDIANAIQYICNLSFEEEKKIRESNLNKWKERFDAEKNSRIFAKWLNKL